MNLLQGIDDHSRWWLFDEHLHPGGQGVHLSHVPVPAEDDGLHQGHCPLAAGLTDHNTGDKYSQPADKPACGEEGSADKILTKKSDDMQNPCSQIGR